MDLSFIDNESRHKIVSNLPINSYCVNDLTKFMINNRMDAWITGVDRNQDDDGNENVTKQIFF